MTNPIEEFDDLRSRAQKIIDEFTACTGATAELLSNVARAYPDGAFPEAAVRNVIIARTAVLSLKNRWTAVMAECDIAFERFLANGGFEREIKQARKTRNTQWKNFETEMEMMLGNFDKGIFAMMGF